MRRIHIWIGLVLVVGVTGLLQLSCGSSSMTSSKGGPVGPPVQGSVVLMGGDEPVCDVLSFTVTITSATLASASGSTAATLISSSSPVTVDFAQLMDFMSYLNLASAPAGTYQSLNLTLANPQLTVLDLTKTPPQPLQVPTTLTNSNVNISLNPALVLGSGATVGLEIDFNLLKSVQVDSNGNVTGTVSPVMTLAPSTSATPAEMDDIAGIVQGVSTQSSANFTGSITLEDMDNHAVTVNTTSSTVIEGASGLSAIQQGTFVEIDAVLDASGAIEAKEVDVEVADTGQTKAYAGYITAVTRDSSGNAQQFTMVIRTSLPSPVASVPDLSSATVSISASTQFGMASQSTNVGGLQYSPATVGVGQEVVVHAPAPQSASGSVSGNLPPALAAAAVFLRPQALLGNFSKLLTASADDIQGGFDFIPCEPLLAKQPMPVFTFAGTQFSGVTGLNQLTPQPTLVVKGLLFYMPQQVTINGIAVQPPTMLFEAKGVEQLP